MEADQGTPLDDLSRRSPEERIAALEDLEQRLRRELDADEPAEQPSPRAE